MKRDNFINACNNSLKGVRTEYSFNQEKMAYILGLSKKTLVEIEKGRSSLGWSGSVTLCTIFADSSIIKEVFGGSAVEIIRTMAFEDSEPQYRHAHTTRIWWNKIYEKDGYVIEQNIVSQHYRLSAPDNSILASSFNIDDLYALLK